MSNTAPWELYAKTMFNHFGFPLWHAGPDLDDQFDPREVELGAVGYLDQGKFRHLFNARKAKDDPFNRGRVPDSFEPFNPRNLNRTPFESTLHQPYIASDSVLVSMEGSAASPAACLVSVGGSLSFECKQNTGAVLLLDQPAMAQSITTKRHIVTYLRNHMESIFQYATGPEGHGRNLQMHDIKFVSGTLKTTRWACATFSGSYRNKTGSFKVGATGVGDVDVSVSIEDEIVPSEFCNNGPTASKDGAAEPSSTPMPAGCDQCVFFHYFSLKKRDLSSNATKGAMFDPVAILLDYMLAKTEAEYAIASDRDVLAIFGAEGIPDDIAAGLEAIEPHIEVDEDNVAAVEVDMSWLNQQTSEQLAKASTEEVGDSGQPESSLETENGQDHVGPQPGQQMQGGWDPAVVAHTGAVTSLAVSPDSQWVASGSKDTMIILWEVETQSVVRKWESHGDIVWHLAFSPDSLRLASSGGEGRIMVWDVDTGEHLATMGSGTATMEGHTETMEGHTGEIHTVLWSPDGAKLASGSDDMTVRIWDGQTYECLHLLKGHNAKIKFVLFSHNGQYLASGGEDGTCRLWDVATGALHKELNGQVGMLRTASFDPADSRIATASDDGSVRVWNVEMGEELKTVREHHGPVWAVSFSPGDEKQILSESSDSTLKICESFTRDRVVALEGHDSMINSATFSPDGRFVASASSDKTVRLWRRGDGTNLETFNEHNDKVTHAVFSPDGQTLSSGSDDGTVRIRILNDFVRLN